MLKGTAVAMWKSAEQEMRGESMVHGDVLPRVDMGFSNGI